MQICSSSFSAVICSFTFEVNDTNSRPSTSSSSGCIATVNDGLWTTVGEAAAGFHSFPREFAQRLLILFFLLRYSGDDPGVDIVGVLDIPLGVTCLGVTLTAGVSSLGSTSGGFWTSTSSPRACLPLKQGTYGSSWAAVDIMGFRTSLVSGSFDRVTSLVSFSFERVTSLVSCSFESGTSLVSCSFEGGTSLVSCSFEGGAGTV